MSGAGTRVLPPTINFRAVCTAQVFLGFPVSVSGSQRGDVFFGEAVIYVKTSAAAGDGRMCARHGLRREQWGIRHVSARCWGCETRGVRVMGWWKGSRSGLSVREAAASP